MTNVETNVFICKQSLPTNVLSQSCSSSKSFMVKILVILHWHPMLFHLRHMSKCIALSMKLVFLNFVFVFFSLLWEFTNCEHLDVELQFVVQLDVYNLTSKEYVKKRYEEDIDY
jgi:hypothetical protein